ncbi:NusG domain II-containing protein [Oceanobacillus sp. FSL K6-3682]|uniref:NusG domain II-containing protein n=1 Tax=Oceanobacillus sp. FSL K6-3682 TaxID=2921503 RepID=UPI0030DA9A91
MKDIYHMLKPWDVILTVLLVLLSFLPIAIFVSQQSQYAEEDSVNIAVITVDNEVVEEIQLTDNMETREIEIAISDHDNNIIEVDNERIHIKSATCPDQICVRTGYISRPGQTIVCLPHKLVVEIQSDSGETEDIIISS